MATEDAFSSVSFDTSDTTKRRNGSGSGKRKRDSLDAATANSRAAPNTRSVGAAPGSAESFLNAALNDLNNNPFSHSNNAGTDDASANQFDFSLPPANTKPLETGTVGHESGSGADAEGAALDQQYGLSVTQSGDDRFADQSAGEADDNDFSLDGGTHYPSLDGGNGSTDPSGGTTSRTKPSVGSDDWHKLRKDNHKEVERRRRETINEGINELAKIVPGCEKNKGSILQRAVQYITKLQDEATQNIDKWTFEKLVTDQALTDLGNKLSRAWQEKEAWKRLAREAGVDVDTADLGLTAPVPDAADSKAMSESAPATTAQMQGGGSLPATEEGTDAGVDK